jgi:glycosyltransferase involved in cell wall biosynthesis
MPIDLSKFAENPGERARSLLFVGRLNAQKGIADLIDAMAAVPADLSLDIVGDGPDERALRSRAAAHRVDGRVRWHGKLPPSAVASFCRTATAVVMPSHEEGLGLVAAESLLTGTPVIAYRSGGIPDLVSDGTTGILVPPGDVRALAGSITALAGDPARARAMGAAGRAQMVDRFAPAKVAATYAGIYRSVTT